MTDFLLTQNGDLSFTESNATDNRIKISFFKSKTPVLKISFKAPDFSPKELNKNTLTINFNFSTIQYNKTALLVQNEACLLQQIFMRLKTSLGELPLRKDFGSKLETVMHQNLNDDNLKNKVEQLVSNAIKDIVYNCRVVATPYVKQTNSYNQVMMIEIYSNNELIYDYEMEW